MSTKLLYSYFVSISDQYKEYNNCPISILSFPELFPVFNWAKVIGNLLRIWLGVSIFSPSPNWFSLLNSRISSAIFNILSGFSIYISFLDIFLISSFKSIIPLLITLFFFLFIVLYNNFAKTVGDTKLKCFLNNS